MKYAIVIEKVPDSNYSAYVPDLPGCVATADTFDEINRMHLAYGRVGNKTSWDGSANAPLLKEFTNAWTEFIDCLNPLYETEFVDQLRNRGL